MTADLNTLENPWDFTIPEGTHITAPAPRSFGIKARKTMTASFEMFPEINPFRWALLTANPDEYFRVVLGEILAEMPAANPEESK